MENTTGQKLIGVIIILVIIYFTITIPIYQWIDWKYEFEGTQWQLLENDYSVVLNELEKNGYQALKVEKRRAHRAKIISIELSLQDFEEGFKLEKIITSLGYKGFYHLDSRENYFEKSSYSIQLIKVRESNKIIILIRLQYSNDEITRGLLKNMIP